jgi:hypothetical protein
MNKAELTSNPDEQKYGPLKGKCCTLPGEKLAGTYFFAGAGMDGEYIKPLVMSLHKAGIKSAMYVDRDKWSAGTALDASVGSVLGREYDPRFPMLLRVSNSSFQQFNLVGYSYGSIMAAQLALKYALKGTIINNLVLIGSPISKSFLLKLKNSPSIKNLIVIDLDKQGDPIYAGMKVTELVLNLPILASQMPDSKGHFYYADPSIEGNKRRKELSETLYKAGLR